MEDPDLDEVVEEHLRDLQEFEEISNFVEPEAGDANEESDIASARKGFLVKYLDKSSDKYEQEIDLKIAC